MLAIGRAGTAEHVERIVRGWRRMDRKAEASEDARRHVRRALHVYQDEDGMVVIRGRLAPEVGAVLIQALNAARDALYQQGRAQTFDAPLDASGEAPPLAQQQADALALLAETALRQRDRSGLPRASAIRSSSTSMPRCWQTWMCPASRSSKTVHAFPRKRLGASRATRAAS